MTSAREAFSAAIDRSRGLWQSVDVRVLAIHVEGSWRNLAMRAQLNPSRERQVRRLRSLPKASYLRAWQVVRPLSELNALLDEQQSAAMLLQGDRVLFQRNAFYNPPFHAYELSSFQQIVASDQLRRLAWPWPGYVLSGTGDNAGEIIQRSPGGYAGVDAVLRDLPRPYRSIGELARYVVGSARWGQDHQSIAEWYAPLEAQLDLASTDYRAGTLRYRVVAGSRRALRHAQLFVHPQQSDQFDEPIPKVKLPVASLRAEKNGRGVAVRGRRTIADSSGVTLTLRVGHEPVQWHDLKDYRSGDRNARLALYEVADPNAEILREWLFPSTKEQRSKFEVAVGRLFLLAGFQVDLLTGDKRLDDGVDLLAHDVTGARCLAIECTTGSLNSGGKMGKLVKRVSELQAAAPDIDVIAVLATSSPREALSDSELQAAAADELRVIDAQGLERLLSFVERNATVAEVVEEVERGRPVMRQGLRSAVLGF